MPAYETPDWALRQAIGSVRQQLYSDWELCVLSMTRPKPPPVEIFHEIFDLGDFLDVFLLVQPDRKRLESVGLRR
jgi:hypothetical protein